MKSFFFFASGEIERGGGDLMVEEREGVDVVFVACASRSSWRWRRDLGGDVESLAVIVLEAVLISSRVGEVVGTA